MSKTIEEIKDEYANEISPHGWFVMTMRQARITDAQVNEVAERYAQSQTQYLIKRIDAKQGQIDKLIKKYDRREIDFKSQTQNLQEQNAELVSMLKQTARSLYGNGFPRLRSQIEELLTKHNHLNKK